MFNFRLKVLLGFVLSITLLVLASGSLGWRSSFSTPTLDSKPERNYFKLQPPANAYLPYTKGSFFTPSAPIGAEGSNPSPTEIRGEIGPPSIFESARDAISNFSFTPSPDLPSLPQVADNELVVTDSGAADLVGYYKYLALHYREIDFDYKKLNRTLGESDAFYPSPSKLIDRALAGGSSSVKDSLGTLKEFARAKIEFEKKIPVSRRGIPIDKEAIGFDLLTVQLIEKFESLDSGDLTKDEFTRFYTDYKTAADSYSDKFKESIDGPRIGWRENLIPRIAAFLGLADIANAQAVPALGGPIILQTICTCSFVGAITVGPPVGGNYALPPVFTLFPNFSPTIGHFVLGVYAPAPVPCLQFVGLACVPDPVIPGAIGIVILMGTS